MSIKVYKPTTPARRKTSVVTGLGVDKKRREKSLTKKLKKHSGRNSQGKITVRHRGGGSKKIYRQVDFKRSLFDQKATVKAIEYDPNRSARIALIEYENKQKSYVLAWHGAKVNDIIKSSNQKIPAQPGNRMPLEFIPQGHSIYNVELEPDKGGILGRSAGSIIILQNVEGKHAQLKMPSGEIRLVKKSCLATIGQVSNPEKKLIRIGKAGRKRHMGIRPTVRGKAMNPNDHPHGGGEGAQPIGMKHPKTPWGKPALGVKTRKPGKISQKLIIKKRKKNKRR